MANFDNYKVVARYNLKISLRLEIKLKFRLKLCYVLRQNTKEISIRKRSFKRII